jgi:hypothetical protein
LAAKAKVVEPPFTIRVSPFEINWAAALPILVLASALALARIKNGRLPVNHQSGRHRAAVRPQKQLASLKILEITADSTNIEHFSYVTKFVALTHQYVELSLVLSPKKRTRECLFSLVGSWWV